MRGCGQLRRGQPLHQRKIGRQAGRQLRRHGRHGNLSCLISAAIHRDNHRARTPSRPILRAQQRAKHLDRCLAISRNTKRNRMPPSHFGRRRILPGRGIIRLRPRLITEQVKGEAAVRKIGAIQTAQGYGRLKKPHGLRRIFELHHRRAKRRLDNGITRRQLFSARQKAECRARVPQCQSRPPGLRQGGHIAAACRDPGEGSGQQSLIFEPGSGGGINRRLRGG
jgi:hypothetical protein